MDPARFQDTAFGEVLKIGSGEEAYWAFVPKPLPPRIDLDAGLVNSLSEAYLGLGELGGLGRTIANPLLLIRPFVKREAVYSSRIEGTRADIADLYAYEIGQLSFFDQKDERSEADVKEVANYAQALEYGLDRLSSLPISLRLIRETHKLLMTGVRGSSRVPGQFRRVQNYIGSPACKCARDADFVFPPVPQMKGVLDQFEKYIHASCCYPPLLRIGMIHYQFETIHPFLDGNGRIGRLLIALMLVSWKLLPLPLLYLSAFFERRRGDYYDLLRRVSERGAWREWLVFFLTAVTEQSRDAIDTARKLQNLQQEWRTKLSRARTSALLLRLVDNLFEMPIVTIPRVQRILGDVTYPTAQRAVGRLIDAGILEQWGEATYGKSYVARGILDFL